MAFVLAPEAPVSTWLSELDGALERSSGFFVDRPVILNLSAINLGTVELTQLIADLHERGIRILAIEANDPSLVGLGFPPRLRCGRIEGDAQAFSSQSDGTGPAKESAKPSSLLRYESVRSGQAVIFLDGDVTIVGSVASGAEVVAGGSIHVYGTLRGRALAGANGNSAGRIFCSKNEAELLAIDGAYCTADDMQTALKGLPIQCRLEGGQLLITALE
jgi:septum site-determining protein MinC